MIDVNKSYESGYRDGYEAGLEAARIERNERVKSKHKKYLEKLKENPNDKRHGTRSGYVYGCRCDACKAARHDSWMKEKKGKNIEQEQS